MADYAKVDSELSKSQLSIGESSNLAQIAQTYACNFPDQKYIDYVCILSVIAQVAIDNAKRKFDIDINDEIRRIKKDMDVKKHGYPCFWEIIRPGFERERVNWELTCPMNFLYSISFPRINSNLSTIPTKEFFVKHPLDLNRKTCKKVEELIDTYSLMVGLERMSEDSEPDYFLLRNDFDELIKDIKKIKISKNYLGLFSWLITRGIIKKAPVSVSTDGEQTTISKNRSLLLKVLYTVNRDNLLKCFKSGQNLGHF